MCVYHLVCALAICQFLSFTWLVVADLAQDYLDAFERLMRLKVPGEQQREYIRVLVECCLQVRRAIEILRARARVCVCVCVCVRACVLFPQGPKCVCK